MYIQSESENVLTTFFSSIQNNIGLNLNFLDFCQFNWIRKLLALWNNCILQCWVWGPKHGNKAATMWRQGRILCGNLLGKAWNALFPKINQFTHSSHTIHTILNGRVFMHLVHFTVKCLCFFVYRLKFILLIRWGWTVNMK